MNAVEEVVPIVCPALAVMVEVAVVLALNVSLCPALGEAGRVAVDAAVKKYSVSVTTVSVPKVPEVITTDLCFVPYAAAIAATQFAPPYKPKSLVQRFARLKLLSCGLALGSDIHSIPALDGAEILLSPEIVWLAMSLPPDYWRHNSLSPKTIRLVTPSALKLQYCPDVLVIPVGNAINLAPKLSHFSLGKRLVANRANPAPLAHMRIRTVALISQ
jgi:hypothetical protein